MGTLRPLRKVNPKDANEGSNAEFAEVTQRKKRRGKTRTLRTDPSILSGQAGEARTQDPYARTAYGALSILELERVRHTGVGNLRPTLTKKTRMRTRYSHPIRHGGFGQPGNPALLWFIG